MATIYTLAQSVYDNLPPIFAVVVTDRGFEYVWASDIENEDFDFQSRMDLAYPDGAPDGLTSEDYKNLAFFNVGGFGPGEWIETRTPAQAKKEAKKLLNEPRYLEKRQALRDGPDSSDKIARDIDSAADEMKFHTEDFDDVDSLSADQMALFVLNAVGGIDPEGPNGWMLRQMMGEEPRPGDENGFVVFGDLEPTETEEVEDNTDE